MSIQRWDPLAEMMSLREAMNRLFEESVVRPGSAMPPAGGQLGLAIDLRETDDSYILEAAVPGLKPDDLDISVLGNQVTIQGETKQEQDRQGERYHVRERRVGRFQRTVSLPTGVQADQATAEFRDGLLILRLPKAQEARPRRIPIGGGQRPLEVSAQPMGTQPATAVPTGGQLQSEASAQPSGGQQPVPDTAENDASQPPGSGSAQELGATGGRRRSSRPQRARSTE